MLLGKTVGLLQLYLQPPLQGYPSFNNFPALYNASSRLSMLLYRDLMSVSQRLSQLPMDSFESLLNGFAQMAPQMAKQFEANIPEYLRAAGMFVSEFGNINSTGQETLVQIKTITGNLLYCFEFSTPTTVDSRSNVFQGT